MAIRDLAPVRGSAAPMGVAGQAGSFRDLAPVRGSAAPMGVAGQAGGPSPGLRTAPRPSKLARIASLPAMSQPTEPSLFEGGGTRATPAWLGTLAKAAAALASLPLLPYLAFANLRDFPATWFDEGSHLLLPKNLVRNGTYTSFAGPTIGVGPTVMLPIAA